MIDEYTVCAIHTGHVQQNVIAMTMTFDGQKLSCTEVAKRSVGQTGQCAKDWCAKEEVSSSLLGKLAPPCLCYKHIVIHFIDRWLCICAIV